MKFKNFHKLVIACQEIPTLAETYSVTVAVGGTLTLPVFAYASPAQNSVPVYELIDSLYPDAAVIDCAANFGGSLCSASNTVEWELIQTKMSASSWFTFGATDAIT